MIEVWKPVVGYEGFYEVSSLGAVRRVMAGQGARAGKLIKLLPNKRGYHRCGLCRAGKPVQHLVHHLVAAAFIGPRPQGLHVNHRNGQKADNRPENLEYVTNAENTQHARTVLGYDNSGPRNGSARFTEADVLEMRAMRLRGMSYQTIADHFGCGQKTAWDNVTGRRWGWL
jgi:hypothetical protein